MDVKVPFPNQGMSEVLMSGDTKKCMQLVASEARRLFIANAPKRSGKMIASTRAYVNVDARARTGPRWVGNVRVGVDYGVWNQMGAGPMKHPRSTGNMPRYGPFEGAYTFNRVVALMGAANGA